MRKLTDLSIVMMGASGGIGSATALRIAAPGVKIALCSIDAPGLEKLSGQLTAKGAEIFHRVVDVTKETEIKSFIDDAAGKFGRVDVLMNFAGLSVTAKVGELTEEGYDLVMDVNVKGMFFGIKHFVAHVNEEIGAQIINFGSMASKRANAGAPHYSAAKAAVNMFSQGLAEQLKGKNIRITTMNPGPADTAFYEGRIAKDKRTKFMQADDVAEVVEFILTRDDRIVFHDVMFDSFAFYKG
jgi:NADP-dependent 3-hydroxy acid dehydrogenase YdfG